jgi:hypothetical protein
VCKFAIVPLINIGMCVDVLNDFNSAVFSSVYEIACVHLLLKLNDKFLSVGLDARFNLTILSI